MYLWSVHELESRDNFLIGWVLLRFTWKFYSVLIWANDWWETNNLQKRLWRRRNYLCKHRLLDKSSYGSRLVASISLRRVFDLPPRTWFLRSGAIVLPRFFLRFHDPAQSFFPNSFSTGTALKQLSMQKYVFRILTYVCTYCHYIRYKNCTYGLGLF